jgi:hypothetical protein
MTGAGDNGGSGCRRFSADQCSGVVHFVGAILLVRVVGASTIRPPLLLAAVAAFLVLGAPYVVQRHRRAQAIELALARLFIRMAPQAQKRAAEFQMAIGAIARTRPFGRELRPVERVYVPRGITTINYLRYCHKKLFAAIDANQHP